MEPMNLNVRQWQYRGMFPWSPDRLREILEDINDEILAASERLTEAFLMTGIDFTSQNAKIDDLVLDLTAINSYIDRLPGDIDALLDHPLFEGFANGPTEALSHIKSDDIETDNTLGVEGQVTYYSHTNGIQLSRSYEKEKISFDDFAGIGQNGGIVPGFAELFEQDYTDWKTANPDQDIDLNEYLDQLVSSGEYGHEGYHPIESFASGVLDFTIVWPIYKSITGFDPITGEDLSGLERGLGVFLAVLDLAGLAAAVFTAGGSVIGAQAVKVMIKAAARELLINALATGTALLTYEIAVALDLPPSVATLLAMGVGMTVTIKGTKVVIQRLGPGQTPVGVPLLFDLKSSPTQTVRTISQAESGRTPTPDDVKQALLDAQGPHGIPVDWRTGEPLRASNPDGSRAWYMKWDPDNERWVAENPGAGYEMPQAGLPATGKPNSFGYDSQGHRLPYANHRPDFTEEQILTVWRNAQRPSAGQEINADGSPFHFQKGDVVVQDIDGNWYKVEWEPGQPRNWDMGHTFNQKYSVLRSRYLSGKIDFEEFLGTYRNPKNYQVQDPLRNRSHVDE